MAQLTIFERNQSQDTGTLIGEVNDWITAHYIKDPEFDFGYTELGYLKTVIVRWEK